MKARIISLTKSKNAQAMYAWYSSLSPIQRKICLGLLVALGTFPLWMTILKGMTVVKSVPAVAGGVKGAFIYKVPASMGAKVIAASAYSAGAGIIASDFADAFQAKLAKAFENHGQEN